MSRARVPCPVPDCKVGRNWRHMMCKKCWPKAPKRLRDQLRFMGYGNPLFMPVLKEAVDAVWLAR